MRLHVQCTIPMDQVDLRQLINHEQAMGVSRDGG
jgi:hypothetical protein